MTKKWIRFLIIWAIALIILGLIGCIILYKYCSVYEITRDEPVMIEMMESMDADAFRAAARNNCNFEINEFEDPTEIYDSYILNSSMDDGNLSYRKEITLSDNDKSVYTIRSGITPIAQVTLLPDEKVGFGRSSWKLGYISSPNILSNLNSVNVSIFAPADEIININGINVNKDYISDNTDFTIPGLLKYENTSTLSVKYVKYDIGKMYGSVKVTDSNGNEISCVSEGTEVQYTWMPEELCSIKVSAPEDVKLFINGISVSEDELTVSDVLFNEIYDYTSGNEYNNVTLNLSGFVDVPAVTAEDSLGNSLTPIVSDDGRYTFLHKNENDTQTEFESIVSDFFAKYKKYATEFFSAETQGSLLNRCLRKCSLYNYFYEAEDALYWSRSITTTYSEEKFDNFSMVGGDCFVCSCEYTINQTSKGWTEGDEKQEVIDSAYEFVFVHYGDMWVCAKMEAVK